jgi:hypothetical protein
MVGEISLHECLQDFKPARVSRVMKDPIRVNSQPGAGFLSRSLLALLLVAGPGLSGADRVEPAKAGGGKVAQPDAAAAWQRRLPELMADNLPLEEIVQELRRQFPEINFLLRNPGDEPSDVGSVSVRMVLRAVTLSEILKALELAASSPIQVTGVPDERLVVFEMKRVETGLPPAGIETRIFNLRTYLENRTQEEEAIALKQLEDVVRVTAIALANASSGQRLLNPQLKFHPSTKLLIVVGRPAEVQVVQEVVKELQGPSAMNKITSAPERR